MRQPNETLGMKLQSDVQEFSCPSCGNLLHPAGLARRRKVQCPKCRETVDIGGDPPAPRGARPKAAGEPVFPAALMAELEELRSRVTRLEALEARVAALESGLEPGLPPATPHPAGSASARKRKLRWMPHTESFREAGFSEEAAGILVHNLSAVRPHTIAIRSPAGDTLARERAMCFKELFERSHWSVRGPHDTYAPIGERGLILAVRTFPVPAEVTAAFIALTASGFSVISRLDPHLESDEALLIVA